MKNLNDLYELCSDYDKKVIDLTIINLINTQDIFKYLSVLYSLNNKYIEKYDKYKLIPGSIITKENQIIIHNDINYEIDAYLKKKYKNNNYFEPVTFELLNNEPLFNKYIGSVTRLDRELFFIKMLNELKNNKKVLRQMLVGINYNNFYSNRLVIFYLNILLLEKEKFTNDDINFIIHYFAHKEAFDKKIYIKLEIVKITKLLKKLLSLKSLRLVSSPYNNKSKSGKKKSDIRNVFEKRKLTSKAINIKAFLQDKRFILRNIEEYKTTLGTHSIISNTSLVRINVSNFKNKKENFEDLLITIYHELRHAFQASGIDSYIYYENVRDKTIIKFDHGFYDSYYEYMNVEIDAKIYELLISSSVIKSCFPTISIDDNKIKAQELYYEANKYAKRFLMDNKIDDLIRKNTSFIGKTLEKEYYSDGTPKGIIDVLRNYNITEAKTYNEIILRCLNRSRNNFYEILNYIKDVYPYGLILIGKAIDSKVGELMFLTNRIKKAYNDKIIDYYMYQTLENKIKEYRNNIYIYSGSFHDVEKNSIAKI